jgi:hypothetical protein
MPQMHWHKATLRVFVLGVALLASISSAKAVLVASGNGNLDAASLDAAGGPGSIAAPGWFNVGISSAQTSTVIYLGNNWVLGARHATHTSAEGGVYINGNYHTMIDSSKVFLTNSDNSDADLVLFRLEPSANPLPPAITPDYFSSTTPSGRQIMIGYGRDIGAAHSWDVDQSESPWVWTEASPGDEAGFDVDFSQQRIRWGENMVDSTGLPIIETGSGLFVEGGYTTQFDDLAGFYTGTAGLPSEAQASNGDSGGAVFSWDGTKWQLAGMMVTVSSPRSGQPANTAIYGDQTLIADLSVYREQILAVIVPEPGSLSLAGVAIMSVLALAWRRRRRG